MARDLTVTQICRTKWGSDERAVTAAMKQQVVDAYSFDQRACPITIRKNKCLHRAEIDHLIPRSLGGADDVANLWPQCYEPVRKPKRLQAWGANRKDRLEKHLHGVVCQAKSEQLLRSYQAKFKHDWIALYREIYGDE